MCTKNFLMLRFPAIKAEICFLEYLASRIGSVFLTSVPPAFGCGDVPVEAEKSLYPVYVHTTSLSVSQTISTLLYAKGYHICTGILQDL